MAFIKPWEPSELTAIRSNRQFSKKYLTILTPAVIYTAQVSTLPSTHDKVAQVDYDTGVGTLSDVKVDMTIRFGSTPGGRDLGEERIRKVPTASIFYFGETSEVKWFDADDVYITVVDDFQLREKHLRIVDGEQLVDYDVEYSDQHTNFEPQVMMGSMVRIGWLVGESVSFVYSQLALSSVIGSTISSYLTTCQGAVVTGSTTNSPTVTIDTPGRYVVYSTVTATNGKSYTGVRYIRVHDATDMPFTDIIINDFGGNYSDGGFKGSIQLDTDHANVSVFEEGALFVIHCIDFYDGQELTLSQDEGVGNILLVGRVSDEVIIQNKQYSTVTFEAEGMQEMMKKTDENVALSGVSIDISGEASAYFSRSLGRASRNYYPYGVELAKNTPTKWTDMPGLTVKKAVFDFLHHYTTVTKIMDVHIEDDERYSLEAYALGSTIWEKLGELAFQTIFANPGIDQFGRMFVEIEPQLVPEDDRDPVQIMEITNIDREMGIQIPRKPVLTGSSEVIDRVLLSSQDQSNSLAGLYHGWKHNELPSIPINLLGNNRGFTLFPRQTAYIEIDPSQNSRGLSYAGNVIPRDITYEFDEKSGLISQSIIFEAETFESMNTDGDVPGSGDLSNVPLQSYPPLPSYSPIFTGDLSAAPDGPPIVVIGDENKGLLFAENFHQTTPTYKFWNTGVTPAEIPLICHAAEEVVVIQTPSGGWYLATRNSFVPYGDLDFGNIYYAPYLGARWTKFIDRSWINNELGTTGDLDGKIFAVGCNYTKPDEIAFILGTDTTRYFYLGNYESGFTQKSGFGVAGSYVVGNLTFGNGKWIYDLRYAANAYHYRYNADGTSPTSVGPGFGQGTYWTKRAGSSSKLFLAHGGVSPGSEKGLWYSEDNGDNWNKIFTPTESISWNLTVSPDGQVMFCEIETADRGRSLDAGYTWDSSFFTYGGIFCYAYAGGVGTASRWILGNGYVRYSPDGGANWQAKEGNLPYLIPISMSITKIVVPGYY